MEREERVEDVVVVLERVMTSALRAAWSTLPGIVQAVDFTKLTCTVQPAIREVQLGEEGERVNVDLPLLVDVPLVYPQGGDWILTFPVKNGDECLVLFADRCIDAWWQSGGVQGQIEFRQHDLTDGFALVGVRSQPRVLDPVVDAECVQLRSEDGKNMISMSPDGVVSAQATREIKLHAPRISISGIDGRKTQVDINGPTWIHGGLTVDEMAEITGLIRGRASLDIIGTIKSTGDQTAGGISQMGHRHICGECGATGGPI